MLQTDAVAVDFSGTNGVIDDMEASDDVFGASEMTWLAAYQTRLAAGRTPLSEDMIFMSMLMRYIVVKAAHV
jgi:hypothetical protein